MTKPIHVMLVDDEPLVRYTLQKIIDRQPDMQVICHAADGHDALQKISLHQPDIILLDIQMPKMNGLECMKHIRQRQPDSVIVLLTTFDDEHYIIEGLANGARSYLLKTAKFEHLIQHVREALNNTLTMPASIADKLAHFLQQKKGAIARTITPSFFETYSLTRTEQQIVLLLSKRLTNHEIATQMNLQIGTIKNHLVNIFEKLQVNNRQDAITLLEQHLI